jgi:putative PIN family toxin of toxin-antitoxin system
MINSPQYICDTNILVSSLISRNSPPAQTIDYIKNTGLFAFSSETFSELEEVLNRPKFDKFMSKEIRIQFFQKIRPFIIFYDIYQKVDFCRDPKDNKFLDVAIASYADYLITGDEDLLVLKNIGNTSIITPRTFMEIHQR